MTEKEWLEYDGQSTEALLALAATHREDSIVAAFAQALQSKDPGELTEEERVVLAIDAMDREVVDGGFDTFFIRSSVEYAPILVQSLEKVGCPQVAAIAARAVRALGLRPEFGTDEVEAAMQQASQRRDMELDACDKAYLDAPEDVMAAVIAFIRKNASKITAGA